MKTIICNNCVGAEIYRMLGCQFDNPFMWNLIQWQSYFKLIEDFDNIDFTKTKIGTSASQTVAISNTGKGTLHITNISATKRWSVDWTTATIEPGSYKTLTITYTPVKDDSLVIEDEDTWDWSTINIECDAFNEPDYTLSVKGYGVE